MRGCQLGRLREIRNQRHVRCLDAAIGQIEAGRGLRAARDTDQHHVGLCQARLRLPVVLFALEITTLVAATLVGIVTERAFGALGVVVGVAFEIVVIFVVAELAPKTWAIQHTDRAALLTAPV